MKMKKFLLMTVGLAIFFGLSVSVQDVNAQVYGDFDTVKVLSNMPYEELQIDYPLEAEDFYLPPKQSPHVTDRDNGYVQIPIGFPFEFNGELFYNVWVCVNGFITFSPPPYYPATNPNGLFIDANSYPRNVIAPFWGDHYYRTDVDEFNDFMESRISYYTDQSAGVTTIQWKDLNINYKDIDDNGTPADPSDDFEVEIKSSVANFQVKLYKSIDPLSAQGNIEFCYGQIGGNPNTNETRVITKNSSVGVKGEFADFINGLEYGQTPTIQRNSTRLTNQWTPSGATDRRVVYDALIRLNELNWWGDGDVDFSKHSGNKHAGMPQSRFVTVNDARLIMKSVATDIPLDSVRRRAAYHGDVNHDGRYFYDDNDLDINNNPKRKDISFRDYYDGDNIDKLGIHTIKKVFFQVNEYDAAYILYYISARIPELPWIKDTVVQYGKIDAELEKANGIKLGAISNLSENQYQVPVYLNGYSNGPVSVKFNINGSVERVQATNSSELATGTNDVVVFAGSQEYTDEEPICMVTFTSENSELDLQNVRFNGKEIGSFAVNITSIEDNTNDNEILLQNTPNPFYNKTIVSVNLVNEGNYVLAIYDAFGNKVKELASGNMKAGQHNFTWDATDAAGNAVANGAYIYRLTGDGVSVSKKLMYTE